MPGIAARTGTGFLIALCLLLFTGCATTRSGDSDADQESPGAEIDEMDAVTSGGNRQAVLSLHRRLAFVDACTFGLTLTNNLPYKITNIAFRFSARVKAGGEHQEISRNFFEIDPAESQYREISFSGLTCDQISHIEVTDPGRCALGELARLSSQPGECIRLVHIAATPYVKLARG